MLVCSLLYIYSWTAFIVLENSVELFMVYEYSKIDQRDEKYFTLFSSKFIFF